MIYKRAQEGYVKDRYKEFQIVFVVFNNKGKQFNKEIFKVSDKEKLLFLNNSNIEPKIHLNKRKFYLDRNGYENLCKNFVNFIRKNYS